jgi:hypothetical protein
MFNIMLDRLPSDFEGYLIRTDFRIGILLSLLFEDEELENTEKYEQAFELLYGKSIPPYEVAINGLYWFLNGGEVFNSDNDMTGVEECERRGEELRYFSFDEDHKKFFTAFKKLGYDLKSDKMHWFEFLAFLGDIGECALSQAMEFRTCDTSKMGPEQREHYEKMKKKVALKNIKKGEEENSQEIQEFLEFIKQ